MIISRLSQFLGHYRLLYLFKSLMLISEHKMTMKINKWKIKRLRSFMRNCIRVICSCKSISMGLTRIALNCEAKLIPRCVCSRSSVCQSLPISCSKRYGTFFHSNNHRIYCSVFYPLYPSRSITVLSAQKLHLLSGFKFLAKSAILLDPQNWS